MQEIILYIALRRDAVCRMITRTHLPLLHATCAVLWETDNPLVSPRGACPYGEHYVD